MDEERALCGSLSSFTLILSSHVRIAMVIGDLEEEMLDVIGFGMIYEVVGKLIGNRFPFVINRFRK